MENSSNVCYEVDPSRLEVGEALEYNIDNLRSLANKVFEAIVQSYDRFPVQLQR